MIWKIFLQYTFQNSRSNRSRMFFKVGVLKLHSCEYHMVFKNSFFMEQLWWHILKMVKEEISNSTLESFLRERFV